MIKPLILAAIGVAAVATGPMALLNKGSFSNTSLNTSNFEAKWSKASSRVRLPSLTSLIGRAGGDATPTFKDVSSIEAIMTSAQRKLNGGGNFGATRSAKRVQSGTARSKTSAKFVSK